MTLCYLCDQHVDTSVSTGDHVIPRTLLGSKPPKARGYDYGGRLHTHPECNNRFGDETHVLKALHLLGALHDLDATLVRAGPGNPNARFLALNEEKLRGFGLRDFRFFGIHDARSDSIANFDNPDYYADKPRVDPRKTALRITLSVLAKSAAALLVSRYLTEFPSSWNIVCVPYAGDVTGVDLSPFFGKTKPFATDIRVWANRFEADSWVSIYATGTTMVWFFFLIDDDHNLVEAIQRRFPSEQCLQFQGRSLMDLVGHGWPLVGQTRSGSRTPRT